MQDYSNISDFIVPEVEENTLSIQASIISKKINYDNLPLYSTSIKNILARIICIASVATQPLSAAFLWESGVGSAEIAIQEFYPELSNEVKNYINYFVVPIVATNLISDILAVDPLREADDLTSPIKKSEKIRLDFTKHVFNTLFLIFITITAFPVGASSAAIPIAHYLASLASGIASDLIGYSGLSIVAFLGTVYFIMFNNKKFERHINEFVDVIKDFRPFFKNVKKSPVQYLEVWIQTISSSLYRGVNFAYISGEVLKSIFKIEKNTSLSKSLSVVTGISTVIFNMFSRYLPTRDKYLKAEFESITPEEINTVLGSKKITYNFYLTASKETFFAAIRGVSLAILSNELILKNQILPLQFLILKAGFSCGLGVLTVSHNLYAHYKTGLYLEVLAYRKNSIILTNKKKVKDQKDSILPESSENNNLSIVIDINENTALIPENSEHEKITRSLFLFDQVIADHYKNSMYVPIEVINIPARFARFIAFFLFIQTLNEVFFGNAISHWGVVAFAFLWGAEVFKNNADTFRESMHQTKQSLLAKWQLEKTLEMKTKDTKTLLCSPQNFFRPAVRICNTLRKSVYDYPATLIEEVANAIKEKTKLQLN